MQRIISDAGSFSIRLARPAVVPHFSPQETEGVCQHTSGTSQSDDAHPLTGQLIFVRFPLTVSEAMQETHQLADSIFHDTLIAVILHTDDRYALPAGFHHIDIACLLIIEGAAHTDIPDIRTGIQHTFTNRTFERDQHGVGIAYPTDNLGVIHRTLVVQLHLHGIVRKLLQGFHAQQGVFDSYKFLKHIFSELL